MIKLFKKIQQKLKGEKRIKRNIVILCLLGCFLNYSIAQKGKDFILTLNQDTLFGNIVLTQDNEPITFKYQQKKVRYHPSTLSSFGIFDKNQYYYFKSLKSKGGKAVFVKVLAEGKLKLYKYRETHNFANHILNRYIYFIGYTDTELVTVSSSSYQRMIGQFFQNHPNFVKLLKESSFSEVPSLIAIFNQLSNLGS